MVGVLVWVGVEISVGVLVELGRGVSVGFAVIVVVAVGEGKGLNIVLHPVILLMRNMTVTVSRNFLIGLIIMLCFPFSIFLLRIIFITNLAPNERAQ